MDKLTLDNTRDLPMTTNTLAFMQAAYAIFEQLGNMGGDNIIVSGCVVTGSSVSAGYMFLKGKLLPFIGGTIQTNVKIVTVVTDVAVDAGVRQQTSYRAEFGTSANAEENVGWSSIVRIETNKSLKALISALDDDLTTLSQSVSTNADNIAAVDQKVDDYIATELPWASATRISTALDGTSNLRVCKVGKVVYITGKITFDSIPSQDTILFQLPGTYPLFTETVYFGSIDGALGRADESSELKALINTRNIVMGAGGSNGTEQYVSVAIPVI
jgi:hypothetical protein